MEADIAVRGIISPLVVNTDGLIIDGFLRWQIADALGFEVVPIVRVEHLTDAELEAYGLAANKWPSVCTWQRDKLRLKIERIRKDLPKLDLRLTGFKLGELNRIDGLHLAEGYDDLDGAEEPLAEGPTKSARGYIYALGEHRVICGDSLDPAVLVRLMDGEVARCCFTDPPYGVKVNGHVTSSGLHPEFAYASGDQSDAELAEFLTIACSNIAAQLCDGAIAFVCMDHAHVDTLLAAGAATFDQRLNICVWDKGLGGQGSLYRSQHELVVVFKRGNAPHINTIELGKHGRNRTNIWSFPGMGGFARSAKHARELHPTVKPVALVAEALLDVSGPGDVVLDPFGGSGSTLIAAERAGRRARLVEYEPRYVDRIIARWEKLTGRTAILLESAAPASVIAPLDGSDDGQV